MPDASPFILTCEGAALSGESAGSGPVLVLLHGLTATRRYVVMGSRTLERTGHRVISYDARGHGRSGPAPRADAYGYEQLSGDLGAVLDALGVERALLAGASMGAHTAVRFALEHPARVTALALITPSFDPAARDQAQLAGWDALAEGLRRGGVEGFVRAYDFSKLAPAWRATVEKALRQRMAAHEYPCAVADALRAVPRSDPFVDFSQLAGLRTPALVVASRDEPDPGHPRAIAERYAAAIPAARLVIETDGSPIAWQGGRLSRLIAELAARAGISA